MAKLIDIQTAIVLTLSVYKLAERPDILQRIRAEIAQHVGMRRPTYEDIKDMKYLRAFLNGVYTSLVPLSSCTEWYCRDPAHVPTRVSQQTTMV